MDPRAWSKSTFIYLVMFIAKQKVLTAMYRYVKASLDEEDVSIAGLDSLWQSSTGKTDIVNAVKAMRSDDIVEALEDNLDDDVLQTVMVMLAYNALK